MKKIIFGVFAHPDDESFGPAGTLLVETKAGNDVHLITLTAGDAGMNPDKLTDLAAARIEEWKAAGDLIGATSMWCMAYKDATLSNLDMIVISERLVEYITNVIKNQSGEFEVELMSMDLNGITGHIDHIVAGRSACFAFYKLQTADPRFTRIRLACMPASQSPSINTDWLFMEAGRPDSEIDEIIDATAYQDELRAIVNTHHSQRSDGEQYLETTGDSLGMNYFIVKS